MGYFRPRAAALGAVLLASLALVGCAPSGGSGRAYCEALSWDPASSTAFWEVERAAFAAAREASDERWLSRDAIMAEARKACRDKISDFESWVHEERKQERERAAEEEKKAREDRAAEREDDGRDNAKILAPTPPREPAPEPPQKSAPEPRERRDPSNFCAEQYDLYTEMYRDGDLSQRDYALMIKEIEDSCIGW
jgi:hypothetical protein